MTQLQNVRRIGIDARGMQPRSTGLGNYFRNVLVPLAAGNPQVDFYLYSNIGLEAPHAPNIHLRQSAQYQAAPLWMHFSLPKLPQQDGIDIFWGAIGYISTTSSTVSRPRRMTRWNRSVFQTLSGRRADKLVAISSATANDAERIFKRKVNAIVPPAIAPAYRIQSDQEVSRVRAQHRIRGEYFLCVGTLEPRKNVKMLLDAYAACRREGCRAARPAAWQAPWAGSMKSEASMKTQPSKADPSGIWDMSSCKTCRRCMPAQPHCSCLRSMKDSACLSLKRSDVAHQSSMVHMHRWSKRAAVSVLLSPQS